MAKPSDEPVAAATLSLIAFAGCIVPFFPPFLERTLASVLLIVVLGLCLTVALVLHVVFVAIAARQARRSAALWVILTVLFFPVGSIVGLILFEWYHRDGSAPLVPKSVA
jgi:uncharacterized membrane protein